MFGIDAITSYLLVVAIATLLVAVLIWQTHRTGRTVIVWLAAGVLGVILGSIGSYAALRSAGYAVLKAPPLPIPVAAAAPPEGMPSMGKMPGGMPGMGGGMPGMGGGTPGMGGGMGMMGMGGPQPKRDLASLVRKLDLLTGDITVTLTSQQAAAVTECLKDVEKAATMSDDEAKQRHEKLLAVFSDDQKERFSAIELPRRGGPGGPGMGGGMMGKGGMGGGPKQDPDQNPFQQESVAKALKSLRDKLAAKANPEPPKPDAAASKPATTAVTPPPATPKPDAKPSDKKS